MSPMTEPDRGPFGNEPSGSVRLHEVSGGVVLVVTGPLDLSLAPRLRREVLRAVRLRPATLVIDLSASTFLASVGMAELVRAHRTAGAGVTVRIVAAGPLLLRPLELTRLTDELEIRSTLHDALAEA
jgi:anti-anti-sigma factor